MVLYSPLSTDAEEAECTASAPAQEGKRKKEEDNASRIDERSRILRHCFLLAVFCGTFAALLGVKQVGLRGWFAKGFDREDPTSSPINEKHQGGVSGLGDVGSTPYYLTGRLHKDGKKGGWTETQLITNSTEVWALPNRLENATRNHDSIMLELEPSGRQILISILGRWSRSLQWTDLITGQRDINVIDDALLDPAGHPLNNLNHVYTVVVDSLDMSSKEAWLPCGFHGDEVDSESSTEYVRIIDLRTMTIRPGPKLPFAGGACSATSIHFDGPDKPAHVCSFGGTHGSHDRGTFLPYASCYDRVRQIWHFPFGKLPYGFDHGNIAQIPPGTCSSSDPARLLIFNYRTDHYGPADSKFLAYDLPEVWGPEATNHFDAETPGPWYTFADIPYSGMDDEVNTSRDASGMVQANNGRYIVNIAGVHYKRANARFRRKATKFSTIRQFDVCEKKWSKIGDIGKDTFALQSCASSKLNMAVTCGGQSSSWKKNKNLDNCIVSRFPKLLDMDNDPSCLGHDSGFDRFDFPPRR